MVNFIEKLDSLLVRNLGYFNYKNYVSGLNLDENERVLEVGSGGGNLSRFLSKKLPKGKLVCLDNSKYWIGKAKKRLENFKNVEFVQRDILDFNYVKKFDSIIVNYVLHDLEKREKVIDIFFNGLKEKGKVYVREPMREAHGMASEDIRRLFVQKDFLEMNFEESYSFPLRGKVYEDVWKKK